MSFLTSRKFWFAAALAAVLLVAALWLWMSRRPAGWDLELLARLPPQADLYVAADLRALQSNSAARAFLAEPPEISRSGEYERFVEETGFRYQDHLSRFALAKHGSDWVGIARAELDPERIQQYADEHGGLRAQENGHEVYVFGTERPFRLALLESDLALFAIGGPGPLREALANHRQASRSAASELQHSDAMNHIRPGSSLWAVGRMDRLVGQQQESARVGPFDLGPTLLQGSQMLYLSAESTALRLRFRLELYCDTPESAARIADFLQALLRILQVPPQPRPGEPADDTSAFLADLSVREADRSVFIEWSWNEEVWRWLRRRSE